MKNAHNCSRDIKRTGGLFFEIDFIKFMFVVGMFFRHGTFFLYPDHVVEYGIGSLNLFTFFLPVTGAFIFILGYTLALSFKHSREKIPGKYLMIAVKLLLFSMVMAGITYFWRIIGHYPISFPEYFLLTEWNDWPKPGFYILVPIALLYFSYYLLLGKKTLLNLSLLAAVAISFLYDDYYISHYLLFGLTGFLLGYAAHTRHLLDRLKSKWFFAVVLGFYLFLFFIGHDASINLPVELLMLLLFVALCVYPSSWFEKKPLRSIVSFTAGNIFAIYILHVVGFNVMARFMTLEASYLQVFSVSLIYFFITLAVVKVINMTGLRFP